MHITHAFISIMTNPGDHDLTLDEADFSRIDGRNRLTRRLYREIDDECRLEVIKSILDEYVSAKYDFLKPRLRLVLGAAVSKGKMDVFNYIINNFSLSDKEYGKALDNAAKENKLDVIKYIIRTCKISNRDVLNSALIVASEEGSLEIVIYLVEELLADVHAENDSSLFWAARNGNLDVVKYLIDTAGADIYTVASMETNKFLKHIINAGFWEIAMYIIISVGTLNVDAKTEEMVLSLLSCETWIEE